MRMHSNLSSALHHDNNKSAVCLCVSAVTTERMAILDVLKITAKSVQWHRLFGSG